MEIRHNAAKTRFEAALGSEMAVLEYKLSANRIVFVHTGVPEAFEGQGVAAQLVRAGYAYAHEAGLEPVAQCPYVRAYLARHPELDKPG